MNHCVFQLIKYYYFGNLTDFQNFFNVSYLESFTTVVLPYLRYVATQRCRMS